MKLYRFYIKPSERFENSQNISLEDKYPLYAITNDKNLRNIFKSTRDMDKFIEMKSDVTNAEYVEFCNQNNGNILQEYEYEHFLGRTDDPLSSKFEDVKIVSTWFEKEMIEEAAENGMCDTIESISYDFNPFAFKEKYFNALFKLDFISHWKYGANMPKYRDSLTDEEYDNYIHDAYPEFNCDKFELFLKAFSDLFK